MKLEFERRFDRVAGKFICRIFSLFSRKNRVLSQMMSPEKILVILLSEMGSLVLARPMFEHIRRKYPEASIYVLLFEQNREFLEVIDVVPPGNIFSVRNISLIRMFFDSICVLRRVRQVKIDTVIDCELFSRVSSIYSFMSGSKVRVGFHPHTQEGLFRGDFINRPVLYNPYRHMSQQFITLAEAIDSETTPKVKRHIDSHIIEIPQMKVSGDEIEAVLKRFKIDFPNTKDKKLVLVYAGGGLLPIRAWPLDYFCVLCKDLCQKGYVVGITGLEKDNEIANYLVSYCQNDDCINLAGYTRTIRELMIIFHFASLLITNDGGPGHFAAMTPIPSIIFYGPETPVLYAPISQNSFNFHVPLSCSPCITAYNHRNSPCDGNNVCLKNISPKEVLAKAYEILEYQKMDFL